jgi:Cft2 family RNA processing exonuclease
VFYWDDGLKLAKADLAIDFSRRQPRAFISHAHIDHMARHEYALCTPATAALYQARLGPRPTRELPYRQTIDWGGLRLTTYPAGHCLGSAMLLAEDGAERLLYTGDFKLRPSLTADRAELARADVLVMECTYGRPQYRLPPRDEVLPEFLALVRAAIESEATPVVEAYALGKSQEITRLLTDAGFRVLQHRWAWAVSRVYERLGVSLGDYGLFSGRPEPGAVVVVPPGAPRLAAGREIRFAVTGWAHDPRSRRRLGVDHAVAISDHADYDELLEAVDRVEPRVVYCTHGPDEFVDDLRRAGHDARLLGRPFQRRLF